MTELELPGATIELLLEEDVVSLLEERLEPLLAPLLLDVGSTLLDDGAEELDDPGGVPQRVAPQ